jgi:uncharacterized protein
MMAVTNVGTLIKELNARIEGVATALVSRNGVFLFGEMPPGVYAETFAVMGATILGAAAAANTELGRGLPQRIIIEGIDSTTVIVGWGGEALLVTVVDKSADVNKILEELAHVVSVPRPR